MTTANTAAPERLQPVTVRRLRPGTVSGLGRVRSVLERIFAWLRQLRIRRDPDLRVPLPRLCRYLPPPPTLPAATFVNIRDLQPDPVTLVAGYGRLVGCSCAYTRCRCLPLTPGRDDRAKRSSAPKSCQ